MISFEMPLVAIPKARARITRFGAYTPARTKEFENAVKRYARQHAPEKLLDTPLSVFFTFKLPKPKKSKFKSWPGVKPDVDNYMKAIMDALNKIIWEDDSLICHVQAIKCYSNDKPIISVQITELTDDV